MASFNQPMEVATLDVSKGLTPHYYFNFGVYLQVVGERRSTRAEERVLHFDFNFGALKLLSKEAVKLTIKLDVINQVIFDESEPRTVLISCHDDRRYLLDFQNPEENLLFRTAYAAVLDNTFDISKFNRSLLLKGPVAKKGLRGFTDRYLILVPRKLYILSSKTSIYPRSVLSLLDANPRYDEGRNTVHLDVLGKEYVFRATTKEDSLEWFVAMAQGCGLPPMYMDETMLSAGDNSFQGFPSAAVQGMQQPQPPAAPRPFTPQTQYPHQHQQPQQPFPALTPSDYMQHSQARPQTPEYAASSHAPSTYDGVSPDRDRNRDRDRGRERERERDRDRERERERYRTARSGAGAGIASYDPRATMTTDGALSDAGSVRTGASHFTDTSGMGPAMGRGGSMQAFKQVMQAGQASFLQRPGMPNSMAMNMVPNMGAMSGMGNMGNAGNMGNIPLPEFPAGGFTGFSGPRGAGSALAPWHAASGGGAPPGMVPGPGGAAAGAGHSPNTSPGRSMRGGSLPGPLPLRAGMARGGRNGSMPGPSTMPPHPGREVPYRFEGVDGTPAASATAFVRPTATTAQGILRDKSNTSPWITDTRPPHLHMPPPNGAPPAPHMNGPYYYQSGASTYGPYHNDHGQDQGQGQGHEDWYRDGDRGRSGRSDTRSQGRGYGSERGRDDESRDGEARDRGRGDRARERRWEKERDERERERGRDRERERERERERDRHRDRGRGRSGSRERSGRHGREGYDDASDEERHGPRPKGDKHESRSRSGGAGSKDNGAAPLQDGHRPPSTSRRTAHPYFGGMSDTTERGYGGGGADSSAPSSRNTTPPRADPHGGSNAHQGHQTTPQRLVNSGSASSGSSGGNSGGGGRYVSPATSRLQHKASLPTVYERDTDGVGYTDGEGTAEELATADGSRYGSRAGSPLRQAQACAAAVVAGTVPLPPAAAAAATTSAATGAAAALSNQDAFALLADIQARLRSLSAESHAAAEAAEIAAAYGIGGPAKAPSGTPPRPPAAATATAAANANSSGTPNAAISPSTEGRTAHAPWAHVPLPYHHPNTTGEVVTSAWLRAREGSAWSTGTTDHAAILLHPPAGQEGLSATASGSSHQTHTIAPNQPLGGATGHLQGIYAAGPGLSLGSIGAAAAAAAAAGATLTSLDAIGGLPSAAAAPQAWRPPNVSVGGTAMGGRGGAAAWRARAEVEDKPCLKPSVVAEHSSYLRSRVSSLSRPRGASIPNAAGAAANAPTSSASAAGTPASATPVDSLAGHRRGMQLLRWTFSNYDSLTREPRNLEPAVLLAAADEEDARLRVGSVGGGSGGGGGIGSGGRMLRDRIASAQLDWVYTRSTQPGLSWAPKPKPPQTQPQQAQASMQPLPAMPVPQPAHQPLHQQQQATASVATDGVGSAAGPVTAVVPMLPLPPMQTEAAAKASGPVEAVAAAVPAPVTPATPASAQRSASQSRPRSDKTKKKHASGKGKRSTKRQDQSDDGQTSASGSGTEASSGSRSGSDSASESEEEVPKPRAKGLARTDGGRTSRDSDRKPATRDTSPPRSRRVSYREDTSLGAPATPRSRQASRNGGRHSSGYRAASSSPRASPPPSASSSDAEEYPVRDAAGLETDPRFTSDGDRHDGRRDRLRSRDGGNASLSPVSRRESATTPSRRRAHDEEEPEAGSRVRRADSGLERGREERRSSPQQPRGGYMSAASGVGGAAEDEGTCKRCGSPLRARSASGSPPARGGRRISGGPGMEAEAAEDRARRTPERRRDSARPRGRDTAAAAAASSFRSGGVGGGSSGGGSSSGCGAGTNTRYVELLQQHMSAAARGVRSGSGGSRIPKPGHLLQHSHLLSGHDPRHSITGSSDCESVSISACSGTTFGSGTADTVHGGGRTAASAAPSGCAGAASTSQGPSSRSQVAAGAAAGGDSFGRFCDQLRDEQQYQQHQAAHARGQGRSGQERPAAGGRGSEVVHSRISLSDFSALASPHGHAQQHQYAPPPQPQPSTAAVRPAGAGFVGYGVGGGEEGNSAAGTPRGSASHLGYSADQYRSRESNGGSQPSDVFEVKQDISSVLPGMSLTLRVKRPTGSPTATLSVQPQLQAQQAQHSHQSQHAQYSQHVPGQQQAHYSPSQSRSGSPQPVRAGSQRHHEAQPGDGSFAFPASVTAAAAAPPPQRPANSGWPPAAAAAAASPLPAAAGPAPGEHVTWTQLHALLHSHLHGIASGIGAAAGQPGGDADGPTARATAAALRSASPVSGGSHSPTAPLSPGGEAYRPILNPLFQRLPEDGEASQQQRASHDGGASAYSQSPSRGGDLQDAGRRSPSPVSRQQQYQNQYYSQAQAYPGAPGQQGRQQPQPQPQQQQQQQHYPRSSSPGSSDGYSAVAAAADAAARGEGDIVGLLQALQQAGLALPLEEAAVAAALSGANAPPFGHAPQYPGFAPPVPGNRPVSPGRRRPSITPMTPESSRCIQHAAMVAAEAATSAVSEAMSALSRIGFQATPSPPPPPPPPAAPARSPPAVHSSGSDESRADWASRGGVNGSGRWGGDGAAAMGGASAGIQGHGTRAREALSMGSGLQRYSSPGRRYSPLAAEAGRPVAVVEEEAEGRALGAANGSWRAPVPITAAAPLPPMPVVPKPGAGPNIYSALLSGSAAGAGGNGSGDGGANLACRASSLQSLLQLVNSGGISSDEFLANLAHGGLRSVLRQPNPEAAAAAAAAAAATAQLQALPYESSHDD